MASIRQKRILRTVILMACLLCCVAAVFAVPANTGTSANTGTAAVMDTASSFQIDTVTSAARLQTRPSKITIKKVSSDKKGQITVRWEKINGADKYQIAYRLKESSANNSSGKKSSDKKSTNKKSANKKSSNKKSSAKKSSGKNSSGSSAWKIKTVDASTLNTTIKNRQIAAKYSIKVRAVIQSGSKTLYGKWSSKKSVRVCNGKIVYLTFDDGPSANMEKILKILDKYDVKATFFVTGNDSKYRYVISKASEQGHAIGLHSYSHNYAKIYKSQRAFFTDLKRIQKIVKKYTGAKTTLIRFPGGSSNTVSKEYKKGIMSTLTEAAEERGYVYFDWNVDSEDASGTNVSVSRIVKNSTTVSSSEKYVNILMHCTSSKNTTVEALPKVIKYYKQRGYTFKALSEDSYTAHHPVYN